MIECSLLILLLDFFVNTNLNWVVFYFMETRWWRMTPVVTKAPHHGAGGADTHARLATTTGEDEGCRVSLHRMRTSSRPTPSSHAWIYLLSSFWTLLARTYFSGPSFIPISHFGLLGGPFSLLGPTHEAPFLSPSPFLGFSVDLHFYYDYARS